MDALRLSDCYGARWRRISFWTAVQGLLALAVLTTPQAHAAVECEEFKYGRERLDYNSPDDQPRIRQIEGNHFNAELGKSRSRHHERTQPAPTSTL